MNLLSRINEGLEGKYQGLSNGFDRLNQIIFGLQRGCYTLLGGSSGCYKTTLVDYILLNALKDSFDKGINLNVFYYSFEIDKITKQCNWLAQRIYQEHGVIVSPEKIKGLGNYRLSDYEHELVLKEIPYIEKLFSHIKFRFNSINPTGIYNELWTFGEESGEIIREPYEYKDSDNNTHKGNRITGYKPNDPDSYTLVIMDHMALMKKERGYMTKEVIDKYSEYCTELRNQFKFSFINIQQFNQGLSSVERVKFKGVDLSPQQSDFKDSTNPYQDADIVMGLMAPYKLDLTTSLGYNVEKLGERMLLLKVIKNRLSKDNAALGLAAYPEYGSFIELPDPEKIDYEKYK